LMDKSACKEAFSGVYSALFTAYDDEGRSARSDSGR